MKIKNVCIFLLVCFFKLHTNALENNQLQIYLDILKDPNSSPIDIVSAQYEIGVIYSMGDKDTPKDYAQAIKWFDKAINNSYQDALFTMASQVNIGDLYRVGGNYILKDDMQALKHYTEVINNPNKDEAFVVVAKISAAEIYYFGGNNVAQDHSQALYYFNNIANPVNNESIEMAIAQYYLGVMHLNGYAVSKNITKASNYFVQAFIMFTNFINDSNTYDITLPNYYVGQMYSNGYGVVKDIAIALDYFKKVEPDELWQYQQAQIILNTQDKKSPKDF
ncbi:MAG: tetratricopeptide repeat protein [Candidatus Babeliales bacterium]|nr:tetratricopeptide repeat protein [Candidatus Babeliales bacterium]